MYHLFILDSSKLEFENREAYNYYDNAYLNIDTMKSNGWVKDKSTCTSNEELIEWLCFKLDEFEGCTAAIYDDNNNLIIGGVFDPSWLEELEEKD